MRVGDAYTQTAVLAKGRAEGSAGEIEELGRELGLAGASPSPKAGSGPWPAVDKKIVNFVDLDPFRRKKLRSSSSMSRRSFETTAAPNDAPSCRFVLCCKIYSSIC